MLSKTSQRAIDAYGGVEMWQNSKFITAEVSVKGLAFTLKRRPFFEHANIEMEIKRPYSKITPIGKDKNISGVFENNKVRLENPDGTIIAERETPRKYFPYGRRLFYWDDLDMAYFANYAFWNYFTLPYLLMNKDIMWKELVDGILLAEFPKDFPTHSKIQVFHFEQETGLLKQHSYTADIISKLATAANIVTEHKTQNGITFASLRKVTPRKKDSTAFRGPILIDITVHNFEIK